MIEGSDERRWRGYVGNWPKLIKPPAPERTRGSPRCTVAYNDYSIVNIKASWVGSFLEQKVHPLPRSACRGHNRGYHPTDAARSAVCAGVSTSLVLFTDRTERKTGHVTQVQMLGLARAGRACLFLIGCGSDVPDPGSDANAADGSAPAGGGGGRQQAAAPAPAAAEADAAAGTCASPQRTKRPIEVAGWLDDLGHARHVGGP